MPSSQRTRPIYLRIRDILRKAIEDKRLEEGLVLLEGPLAGILKCTRTPIRQALHLLEQDGLVSRFGGRGFAVGPAGTPAMRRPLVPEMLGVNGETGGARKVFAWEDIYHEVEQAVILHSAFGRYRINELELARVHSVGRLVARDVLIRLESLDILEKDDRGRWSIVPLDRSRVEHLYEIRALLEPAALAGAAPQLPEGEVARMVNTARASLDAYPHIPQPVMDTLETDLHVHTLSFSPNRELFRALERTRSVLIISKHVLGIAVELPPEDPFINEHLKVLTALIRDDVSGAADLLREHIVASAPKVTARVELFRTQSPPATVPYIV